MIEHYLFFPLGKSLIERLIMRHRKTLFESIFTITSYFLIDWIARKAYRAGKRTNDNAVLSYKLGYMNGTSDLRSLELALRYLEGIADARDSKQLRVGTQDLTSSYLKYLREAVYCQRKTAERLEKCSG